MDESTVIEACVQNVTELTEELSEVASEEGTVGAADAAYAGDVIADGASHADEVQAELISLRAELARRRERDEMEERMLSQMREFSEYFPDVNPAEISEEVWRSVKGGVSLAASFALYLRREEQRRAAAEAVNAKNRTMSSGSAASAAVQGYYSPDEVRRMSPAQVRAKYDDIIESMRHWN